MSSRLLATIRGNLLLTPLVMTRYWSLPNRVKGWASGTVLTTAEHGTHNLSMPGRWARCYATDESICILIRRFLDFLGFSYDIYMFFSFSLFSFNTLSITHFVHLSINDFLFPFLYLSVSIYFIFNFILLMLPSLFIM